ncbi:MAG: hypothetical protein KC413_01370 [Anaerolineales bacterium]|nr:hypothetical protein [Anaerolineales bacterium]
MKQTQWLRYLARGWSLLSLAFVLLFVFGELLNASPARPTAAEWLGLILFPGGVCLGLLLAWRYERSGGLLALLSLAAFYIWSYVHSGQWPGGPYFLLVAIPGLFFLLANTQERPMAAA